LKAFGRDLTELARKGEMDPVGSRKGNRGKLTGKRKKGMKKLDEWELNKAYQKKRKRRIVNQKIGKRGEQMARMTKPKLQNI